MSDTKICSMCSRDLPLNCFKQTGVGEYKAHCIACVKEPIKTEDQLRDRKRRFLKHQRKFDHRRDQHKVPGTSVYNEYLKRMKSIHKVEEQEIRDMMDAQLGLCGACGVSLYTPTSKHYPYIDEELLCIDCSIILAYSEASIPRLDGVINYIGRHNA